MTPATQVVEALGILESCKCLSSVSLFIFGDSGCPASPAAFVSFLVVRSEYGLAGDDSRLSCLLAIEKHALLSWFRGLCLEREKSTRERLKTVDSARFAANFDNIRRMLKRQGPICGKLSDSGRCNTDTHTHVWFACC